MSTESQQQIAREAANEIKDKFDGEYLNTEKLTPIILSAIERSHQNGWHEGRQYEVEFGVKSQRSGEQQEWRVVKFDGMARIEFGEPNHGNIICGWCAPIAWALLDEVTAKHNAALAAERQRRDQSNKTWAETNEKLSAMLLSAQAAIADALKAWFPAKHNIEAYEHLLNHDLSLLHQHDDDVRNPIMDALEKIAQSDGIGGYDLANIAADAVAKVKEGKC